MALTFATDPFADWPIAIKPGTPHEPPLSQGREPGGFEMAFASKPAIGK
jgi:hypothetical protein